MTGDTSRPAAAAIAVVLAAVIVAAAFAARDDTLLVSRATGAAGTDANGASTSSAMSADGRLVAFGSLASNLHPDDPDTVADVFVRDVEASTTILVSRAAGVTGSKGNGGSLLPAVSADGRFVAFESLATNLHPDDPDAVSDVFVRDLQAHTTALASRATRTGAKGNGGSRVASISADGRFVAFESAASNLHPDDADAISDVFVRDLQANTTILASRATGAGGAKGTGSSHAPAISADGRFVAFDSSATNLDAADPDSIADVFVRDLQADTTTLASRATGPTGVKGNENSRAPSISAAGRFVAFDSAALTLHPDDTDSTPDVLVRDLQTATTSLASRATGAAGQKGDLASRFAAISADGRFVAFQSLAVNLHPDDADRASDVFVRDLQSATTTLASRASGAAGAKGDAGSALPAISAEGRFVAFESGAANLDAGDTDLMSDVFRRDLLGPAPARPPAPPPPAPPGSPPRPSSLPAPRLGKSVNIRRVRGKVLVRLRGSRRFVALETVAQIPVGSTIDVRRGEVELTAAADRKGGIATGRFWGGIFSVSQTRGKRPITALQIRRWKRVACPTAARRAAAAARKKRKRPKRTGSLWGRSTGPYRSKGKYSDATVRGTVWLVADRCEGTLTVVRRGRVTVRDFVRHRTVILISGRRYLARPRGRR